MNSTVQRGAALVECIAPLDETERRELLAYWDRVTREAWVPPVQRRTRLVPWREATSRERRVARRAVARIAAASGLAPVVSLPRPAAAAGSAVAA